MANLLYQTAFVGDLLLSIPLIRRIHYRFSDEELHLVCRHGIGSFFEELGLVDKAFEVKKGEGGKPYKILVTELRQREYQKVWCPHQSPRTAFIMRRIRAKERVGFSTFWNSWAFEKRVRREMIWPDALRQLSLLSHHDLALAELLSQLKGMENPQTKKTWNSSLTSEIPKWCSMNLMLPGVLSKDSAQKLDTLSHSLMKKNDLKPFQYILVSPGSVWPTKRWTAEGFAKVASQLIKEGMQVVLTGAPGEAELCNFIASQASGVKNLVGKTSLIQIFALMTRAKALVGNDSGSSHLACCAGLPLVSIFGPTTLTLGYRPWQYQAVVVQKDLPCRPCGKHGAESCPIGTFVCMKTITADEVLASLRSLVF